MTKNKEVLSSYDGLEIYRSTKGNHFCCKNREGTIVFTLPPDFPPQHFMCVMYIYVDGIHSGIHSVWSAFKEALGHD